MNFQKINPDNNFSLFVKDILFFEETEENINTVLPFFADGFPGLIFHETKNGLLVMPHNKVMPDFFLHGQTIVPIELHMTSPYKLIVFQLHPFVLKSFFNINPNELNDNCYDITSLESGLGSHALSQLKKQSTLENRLEIIQDLLANLFHNKKEEFDFEIIKAIKYILGKSGQISIAKLSSEFHLTERTFERRFIKSIGVSAKQFAKIIQFNQSLQQITLKDYHKLSDVVFSNGYADQSHFIKVFKAYTGKTPKAFKARI